jgi:hypothetical protein
MLLVFNRQWYTILIVRLIWKIAMVLTWVLWAWCAGTNTPLSNELCAVALTSEEVALAEALLGRVAKLAAAASEKGVRLMIDAEHTYFQPVSQKSQQLWWCSINCSHQPKSTDREALLATDSTAEAADAAAAESCGDSAQQA